MMTTLAKMVIAFRLTRDAMDITIAPMNPTNLIVVMTTILLKYHIIMTKIHMIPKIPMTKMNMIPKFPMYSIMNQLAQITMRTRTTRTTRTILGLDNLNMTYL